MTNTIDFRLKIGYTIIVFGKARKGKNNFRPNGGNIMWDNLFLLWYILRNDDKNSGDDGSGGGGCGCLILIIILILIFRGTR